MTMTDRITAHLTDHYITTEIAAGIAYAEKEGYADDDEALSLVLSRILYSDSQLACGERREVEPGSW